MAKKEAQPRLFPNSSVPSASEALALVAAVLNPPPGAGLFLGGQAAREGLCQVANFLDSIQKVP